MDALSISRRTFLSICGASSIGGCIDGDAPTGERRAGQSDRAIEPVWKQQISAITSPVVADGTLVVGTESSLTGIDPDSGDIEWKVDRIGEPSATPTVAGGSVYVPAKKDDESYLYAFDVQTRRQEWRTSLPDRRIFSPTVVDHTVYVRGQRAIHAVSRSDGERYWSDVGGQLYPSDDFHRLTDLRPVVADGVLYSPDSAGLRAISLGTRSVLWQISGSGVYASPAILDDLVVVPVGRKGVLAIGGDSGDIRWKFEDAGVWTTPVSLGNSLVVTAGFDAVELDRTDGSVLWRTDNSGLHGDIYSDPLRVEDSVIFGSLARTMTAYDFSEAVSGGARNQPLWKLEGGTRFSPTRLANRVYNVDETGSLVSIPLT